MKWFLEQIFDMSPGFAILYVGLKFGESYTSMEASVQAFGMFILTFLCICFSGAITMYNIEQLNKNN